MSNCPNCGVAITVPTSYCPQCGAQLETMQAPPPPPQDYGSQPPSYDPGPSVGQSGYSAPYATQGEPPSTTGAMVLSILTLLFCCQPAGIAGIILTSQAKSAIVEDDYERARSRVKLTYTICAICVVLVMLLVCMAMGMQILAEL